MTRSALIGLGWMAAALAAGCAEGRDAAPEDPAVVEVGERAPDAVRTGAEVLVDDRFTLLAGQRVGLIANHTARIDTVHLSDLLDAAADVELVALFGPEHGVRGTAEAGAEVRGGRDVRTGVPVHSLYGRTHKPTPQMLSNVDVLVFDVQDVGARFYTYISTMGLAMQAAAEQGIPFVVLDRPNPLGGSYVSGFVMEPELESFVGLFPVPIAHGLTVGELARMIQGERMVDGLENLNLQVVEMKGWQRDMLWPATGLPWIAPSPNLPDFESALVYPGTCLFEALNASEGRGTREPFLQLGAPYTDGTTLARQLNGRQLPGVRFEAITFTPEPIPQMATTPRFRGQQLSGIRVRVVDAETFQPVEAGIHIIHAFQQQAAAAGVPVVEREDWLARLSGTHRLRQLLDADATPEAIISAWRAEVAAFDAARQSYFLYE